jgi:glycerophosphoryl diester phosphodiesterase family protein
MNFSTTLALMVLLVAQREPATGATLPVLNGYITQLPPESEANRISRHQKIAARRAGTIVIVHRGASAFAPENTLEAYAAAMDCGADGCEIDLRRTADGVLVLFHDDMLDQLTERFGAVNELTCYELLGLKPRHIYGRAKADTRPPTFAAVLALARQRAMLLHLDIKEPGLEKEIIHLLDAADVWDHIVSINNYNADELLKDPRVKLLRYKAGLFDARRDMDPQAVSEALSRPGEMVIVDDPRVIAHQLRRKPYQPVPLSKDWRMPVPPTNPVAYGNTTKFNVARFVASLEARFPKHDPRSLPKLAAILTASFPERTEPDGDADYQRRRTERIVERAWAADCLAWKAYPLGSVKNALMRQVLERSLDRDWILQGMDGAMASRTLGQRKVIESALVLIDAFRRVDPALKAIANPESAQYPLAWTDFRAKMYVLPALGELHCHASKAFLQEYVAMPERKAREFAPPMFEDATKALLQQELTREELKLLLLNTNTAVRGTAILECLDHPTRARTALLKTVAPWALELPRADR